MMYPLFFKPIYKNIIWGGRNLEKLYNRELPDGKVAESWEIACHKNDSSIILNGEFEGFSLSYLMDNFKNELLGSKNSNVKHFPLLIKIIDACESLSVQVHPNDNYANEHEDDSGKTEMWYIASAKENAKLVLGLKPEINSEAFKAAALDGTIEKCLNYIDVKQADVIYIPSGAVHAILEGIVIIEIQQSSDITYRVYDWNRTDSKGKKRQLHVDKALDVINFDFKSNLVKPVKEHFNGYAIEKLVVSEYFNTEKIVIENIYTDNTGGNSFAAYTVLNGTGELLYANKTYLLSSAKSFLIPASCGEYFISGHLSVIKSYI